MSFKPAPFAGEDDILLQAKPPACDPVTYLTLLEYQLTAERLPLLHEILQDGGLTSEIGWDLVKTLVRFVPESRQCLNDVARLGNPREVILSVAQALERLRDSMQEPDADGDGDLDEEAMVLQYEILLDMLPILQSRLVSKSPSRFLGSALEAVLTTFMELPTSRAATATMKYLSGISGTKRPSPPPRNIQIDAEFSAPTSTPGFRAGDPENERPSSAVVTGQREITRRLAQFALLESLKIYLGGFTEGMPCMNWALRMEECRDTRMLSPQMKPLSAIEAFKTVPRLRERDAVLTLVLNLTDEFGIDTQELIDVISKPVDEQGDMLNFDSIPQKADAIGFERHGCLLLLAARLAKLKLHGIGSFPHVSSAILAEILSHFSDELEQASDTATPEASALVDSILTLVIGSTNAEGKTSWNMGSDSYENLVKNVTTCTQSALYRGRLSAQKIATGVFTANPIAEQRYDLLCRLLSGQQKEGIFMKEPAIGWFKHELMELTLSDNDEQNNPFLNPAKLSHIIRLAFSHLPVDPLVLNASTTQTQELVGWMGFLQTALPAYLAYLNFYHFLTQSKAVFDSISLKQDIHPTVTEEFFRPMRSILHDIVTDKSGLEKGDQEAWQTFVMQCSGGIDIAMGLLDRIQEWGSR
ncbi:hypothetical protein KEM56_002441 [Ascosphaera pollenicola]|nr:hypothetical protein KEM56_002441 [Ascosphaera pollenicola]